MSMPNHSSVLASLLLALSVSPMIASDAAENLGHELSPALGQEIEHYTGSVVSPDGSGLSLGIGTVSAGKLLYETRCMTCHGMNGQQPGNELAGGIGSLSSPHPVRTVGSFWPHATTLYDYIARAMPYNEEKSLTVDEVYSVTAYILYLNGILNDDAHLNEKSLPAITMPNQNGFIERHD
jgi:hypothetical protein